MNPLLLSMVPIQFIDIVGSTLMIILALWCGREVLLLHKKERQNVIWTFLLWFCAGLLIFAVSRSVGHIVRHLLVATGRPDIWHSLRPVSGSLNTIAFIIVGSITLFFSRVYHIYRQMIEDKSVIERAHGEITQLNLNLEKIVRDRTRELYTSEAKYRRLFEDSKDMLLICDKEGLLLDVNEAGAELLGCKKPEEVLGRNFFVDFVLEPKAETLKAHMEERGFLRDEEILLKKNGPDHAIGLLSATLRKENGRAAGFEGTVKDITMRKAMERQLLQADKLASLGQLSAGVAHEINNPLGLILGYTKLVLKEIDSGSQFHEDLKIIQKHAMNCKRIVEDLLKFSRATQTTKTPTNLNDLVTEVLAVVESKFGLDKVRVIRKFTETLRPVKVDPDKVKQVFMNILMNGRQAIEGSGFITVSTSCDALNGKILVSFTDTGSGIPPEIMGKIFDPFFTTKPTGMGTGLGLAVSYGIIKDHEGEIQVESTPGQGSTFTVKLPVDESGC